MHCLRPIDSWYALPQIGKLSTHEMRSINEQSEGLVIVDFNGSGRVQTHLLINVCRHLFLRAGVLLLLLELLDLENLGSLNRSLFSSRFFDDSSSCSFVALILRCFNFSASFANVFFRCCCIASKGFRLKAYILGKQEIMSAPWA